MRALIVACLLCISMQLHAQPQVQKQTQTSMQADDLLARIAAQLDQHAVVHAEFVQSKQISGLKRPLQTSGHMVFARNYGVLWQIEQPYKIGYVLSEDRVVEIAADGSRKVRTASDLPGLAQVGRVFRAMLGANTASLREYFDIQAQGDAGHWTLALTPKQAQMAQFIARLDIAGGAFVGSIRIQETSGDVTLIKLRNSSGANALSESERQLFASGSR